MPTTTTNMSLRRTIGADNARDALKVDVPYNFDLLDAHDHSTDAKGLPVGRLQTVTTPAVAGAVQVTGDTLKWWGASAGAVRTAVDLESAQTISGAKTFSGLVTYSGVVATSSSVQVANSASGGFNAYSKYTADGTNALFVGQTPASAGGTFPNAAGVIWQAQQSADIVFGTSGTGGGGGWNERLRIASDGQITAKSNVRLPNATALQGLYSATYYDLVQITAGGIVQVGNGSISEVDVNTTTTAGIGLVKIANAAITAYSTGGLAVGAPTGAVHTTTGGALNVSAGVYLNGAAYTNPDYVFEHAYTGAIVENADEPGAAGYAGLMTLDRLAAYTREHWHLPGFGREQDLFRRAAHTLEKVEEAYLHLFALDRRLAALEGRGA